MNLVDISRVAREIAKKIQADAKENKPLDPIHVVKIAALLSELAGLTRSTFDSRLFSD